MALYSKKLFMDIFIDPMMISRDVENIRQVE